MFNRNSAFVCLICLGIIFLSRNFAGGQEPVGAAPDKSLGKIAFVSSVSGNWDLCIMNSDGTGLVNLTDTAIDERYPSISQDGEKIAYNTNDGRMWILNIKDKEIKELGPRNCNASHSVWSPDDKKIAFTCFSAANTDDSDIWVVNSDGTDPRRVIIRKDIQINPVWSPDGKNIIFASTVYGRRHEIRHDLWSTSIDGRRARKLFGNNAANFQANFSQDGKKIVFTSDKTGNMEIWVMDPNGKNEKQLTENPAYDADPCWSRDGKKIVFVSNRSGALQLWLMDADGSNLRQLTNNGENKDPDWR